MTRVMVVALWMGFGYGVLGAILTVYAADVSGRQSLLRVGAVLVMLAGASAAGLFRLQAIPTKR